MNTPQQPASNETASRPGNPTIDAIQRDIALANMYRLELIKYLLAIAAALFAFTVTYRPSLVRVECAEAMWFGWAGLAISMFGGLFHMLCWDLYYKSYRDHDWKNADSNGKRDGRKARTKINCWRRLVMVLQFGGFILGVACIGLFAGMNIDNVHKSDESSERTRQQQIPSTEQPSQPSAAGVPR